MYWSEEPSQINQLASCGHGSTCKATIVIRVINIDSILIYVILPHSVPIWSNGIVKTLKQIGNIRFQHGTTVGAQVWKTNGNRKIMSHNYWRLSYFWIELGTYFFPLLLRKYLFMYILRVFLNKGLTTERITLNTISIFSLTFDEEMFHWIACGWWISVKHVYIWSIKY